MVWIDSGRFAVRQTAHMTAEGWLAWNSGTSCSLQSLEESRIELCMSESYGEA